MNQHLFTLSATCVAGEKYHWAWELRKRSGTLIASGTGTADNDTERVDVLAQAIDAGMTRLRSQQRGVGELWRRLRRRRAFVQISAGGAFAPPPANIHPRRRRAAQRDRRRADAHLERWSHHFELELVHVGVADASLRRRLDRALHDQLNEPPAHADTGLRIACDGSFDEVNAIGAWSWYATDGRQASGRTSKKVSSSVEAELVALLHALDCRHPDGVVIVSDCATVVRAARAVLDNHRLPAWAQGPLWGQLADRLIGRDDVEVYWVKGHAGHELQRRADQQARHVVRAARA
jgi:ribonuclease HI